MKIRVFKNTLGLLIIALSLFSCEPRKKEITQESNSEQNNPLFTLISPDSSGVNFFNKVVNQKNFNIFKYRNFYNGGGVAIGDINNDGLPDIYMTANMGPNKLYLNKGNFKFEDISKSAGVEGNKPWSTGVNMVDINNDGFLDIYVSNAGNKEGNNHDNDLYINNGDLTFTEKASEYNLAHTGFSIHATFFDYDKDGDLDAYILNNSNIPVRILGYAAQRNVRAEDWKRVPEMYRGVGDMLLRNDNGKFVDVSEKAGIYGSLIGFGLGVVISDVNGDTYPDIYISNDFYERDYLYINQGDGTFKENIENETSHLSLSAMGIDMADINNDGNADIFITDMLPEDDKREKSVMEFEGYNIFKLKQKKDFYQQYTQNTLQLNNGNNTFSEVAYYSGIAKTDWSWGGLLFDMDNDGYRDIYVTNGINHDLTDIDYVKFFANEIKQRMALNGNQEVIDSIINKMPITPISNYAYRNNHDITFSNKTKDWGLEYPGMSNGCAYGDLDNDGDLDIVVNNVNMTAFVYRNNANKLNKNNYLKLKFIGGPKNTFAIGSSVKLYENNSVILQELNPSRGFQSSMDYTMTIGLGKIKKVDSIRIIYPNNYTQKLTNVEVNQTLTLNQADASEKYKIPKKKNIKPLLKELTENHVEKHKENFYTDFDYEGLVYEMLSQEGPTLAVGDINGNGDDEIFIGGAKMQAGTIYKNVGNGTLVKIPQPSLDEDSGYEDTASAFFDADGDGDLDLMVGSGGNEVGMQKTYKARLYLNNGKGIFKKASQDLPSTSKNISVIAPYDYDHDGDMDVFVGSRSVVGTYGIDPNHLFLENNGDGTFTDASQRVAYDLKDAGMITDAKWADMDGDGKEDLITVSEWGSPNVYLNNGRRLIKSKGNLNDLTGWWNSVEVADLDKDGDNDLILGNKGSNTPYQSSPEHPMKIWINDFDNNGTIEQIVTRNLNGRDMPVAMQKDLTSQMSSLKKQNLKASEYSTKSIDELFSPEVFKNSIMKTGKIQETIIAVNDGNGKFSVKKLPGRVQMSCVCGINCSDINGDGNLDLVMAGNNFEFKPQFSRLDASYGNVLLGDGKLGFNWQDYNTSGFAIKDEVKHIKKFKDRHGNTYLVAAINNEKPKIFKIDEK